MLIVVIWCVVSVKYIRLIYLAHLSFKLLIRGGEWLQVLDFLQRQNSLRMFVRSCHVLKSQRVTDERDIIVKKSFRDPLQSNAKYLFNIPFRCFNLCFLSKFTAFR